MTGIHKQGPEQKQEPADEDVESGFEPTHAAAVEAAQVHVGKHLLIGLTYLRPDGSVHSQVQLYGVISAITTHLVVVELQGRDGDEFEEFTLPFDPDSLQLAPSGRYTLRGSGEVVDDPDLLTTWTIHMREDE